MLRVSCVPGRGSPRDREVRFVVALFIRKNSDLPRSAGLWIVFSAREWVNIEGARQFAGLLDRNFSDRSQQPSFAAVPDLDGDEP